MDYKYDVFLSYTHDFPFGEWVHQSLLKFFEPFLENSLNRPASLFVDRNGIASGDEWPERLKEALAHSRCLVGVWSPSYFNSHWCMSECAVMLYRELQLGYRTRKKPSGLVLPVNVFDGEHFPDFAKRIQYLDCKNFARTGEGFTRTERYVEFQDCIASWSQQVARVIMDAPPWKEEWLTKEWLDDPIIHFSHPSQPKFEAPSLV